jgi:predicted phosphate transport protein (TIGR00153 family)
LNEHTESSLLHWFKQRRNQVILKSLDLHIEKILDTCLSCIDMINHLDTMDLPQTEKLYKHVSMQERSADHIQDELANEIARGMLPPEIREKLFRLVRLADSTANWTKTAGKNLVMLVKLGVDIKQFESIVICWKEILQLTVESVRVFRKMVAALGRDDQTILDNRQIIEDREREADNVHFVAREEILAMNESLGFSVHFLLLDTAKNLENASDSITSAADVMYTIVMLGRPG